MTRWTQSTTVRYIITQVRITREWLDMVSMHVSFCPAANAGIIISLEYRPSPCLVFSILP